MDDRKHLAGGVQPRACVSRAAHRDEEVERDEIQVLVQRLERRHQLLVHADPEVRLAHPHFDVEIAVERLLVGRRAVAGRPHHVVVDLRQHLLLVVRPRTAPGPWRFARRSRAVPSTVAAIQPVVTLTRDQPGNFSRYSRSTDLRAERGLVHDLCPPRRAPRARRCPSAPSTSSIAKDAFGRPSSRSKISSDRIQLVQPPARHHRRTCTSS